MGEWFRGKDKNISDSDENPAAGSDGNSPEGGKDKSPGEPSPATEVSSAVKHTDEDAKGAMAGEGGEMAALEGVKRSSAILSDEEVEKLRDEQDAKYKALEVNVNVFMPYKVGHVIYWLTLYHHML